MPDVNAGLTIEGESAFDSSDPNSETGYAAALAAKVQAADPAEAAPVDRRAAPVTPHLDSAEAVRQGVLEGTPSTRVQDGLVETQPGEAAAQREESDRVAQAREAAASDPDVAALTEQEAANAERDARLAAYERQEAVGELLDVVETSDDPNERAEAWQALGPDGQREALENGYIDLAGADDLTRVSHYLAQAEAQRQAEAQAERAYAERVDALTNEFEGWATERGFTPEQAAARAAEIGEAVQRAGWELGTMTPEEWSAHWRVADGVLLEEARAQREARFKNSMVEHSTSVADGIEILGPNGWIAPNAAKFEPKPDYSRVNVAPRKRESAADVRASVSEESAVSKGMAELLSAEDKRVKAREKSSAR